ncbi:DUF1284 domain-containing protein [Rhizobium sp. RAF56]|jgi:hypothetical protein|uniref:DUF1284 domain-containing protein n=1 Tax=Rhizobium sp. RAF56 TaxID=3233062 RepID=UPI003F989CC3
MIRLRGHHLLCMLTFVGEGYNPAFTDNYRQIAKRLSAGEGILVVAGPDDICAPLLEGESPHCLGAGAEARDIAASGAIGRILGHEIAPGVTVSPDAGLLATLRQKFASGEVREACRGCEWENLCSRIADGGYDGILVDPAQVKAEKASETDARPRS